MSNHRVLVGHEGRDTGVIIFVSVFGIAILIIVLAVCSNCCGKTCESLDVDIEANPFETQSQRNRRLALELQAQNAEQSQHDSTLRLNRRIERQTQLEERQRQSKLEQKRRERREVYQIFLKSFTMITKAEDFKEVPNELSSPKPISNRSIGRLLNASVKSMRRLSTTSAGNRSTGRRSSSTPSLGRVVNLQLPAVACKCNDAPDSSRVVPAFCAICLAEYEVNDAIVWASEAPCPHVFHQECMLSWLSTGKKRCPVCRNWFVPKIALEELRKQLPSADVPAAEERTEERVVPMGSDNEERLTSGVDRPVGNVNEESSSSRST